MQPIKVFVLVNMTEHSFTSPDVGGVIWLELEAVPNDIVDITYIF